MTSEGSHGKTLIISAPLYVLTLSSILVSTSKCFRLSGKHFSSVPIWSTLSFNSVYVHKFVAVAGIKPFLRTEARA